MSLRPPFAVLCVQAWDNVIGNNLDFGRKTAAGAGAIAGALAISAAVIEFKKQRKA